MLILKNTKDNSLIDKTENEKQIEIIQSIEEIKSSDDDISFNEKSTSKNLKYVKERKSLTTKNLKKNFSKLNFASISHKKIERAKKMNLFLKLQEDKKEQNINEMINLYTERCQRNDELVKEDINSQNSFIKARMEQKSYFLYF